MESNFYITYFSHLFAAFKSYAMVCFKSLIVKLQFIANSVCISLFVCICVTVRRQFRRQLPMRSTLPLCVFIFIFSAPFLPLSVSLSCTLATNSGRCDCSLCSRFKIQLIRQIVVLDVHSHYLFQSLQFTFSKSTCTMQQFASMVNAFVQSFYKDVVAKTQNNSKSIISLFPFSLNCSCCVVVFLYVQQFICRREGLVC